MASALFTGVSGLVTHQQMLDVVGNNLANINTIGFKSRRTLFSDVLYETLRPASGPVQGGTGGTNPSQVGSGVQLAAIDTNMNQGRLEPTGETFDFAVQGDGFFVLDNGSEEVFSRAGAFSVDEDGTLVDASSGARVLRFGTVGEPTGTTTGFQTSGDPTIQVPLGVTIPGQVTMNVNLVGNLDAQATGPLAQVLTSLNPYTSGGSAATASTLLNDLDSNTVDYAVGDSITIDGTDFDGSAVTATLSADGTTTVGDLIAAINSAYGGATASLDASGNLVLQADTTGQTNLALTLGDASGNSGSTDFGDHAMATTTEGKGADTFQTSIEVFDSQGGNHAVLLTFAKQGDNLWDMSAAVNPAEGSLTDNSIQQIRFNDDGSIQQAGSSGAGDPNITAQWNGISTPQTIDFGLGSNGSFDGLTQLATESSVATNQDGFGPGALTTVNVSGDGLLTGIATNGRALPIAQLAIASFQNSKGLESLGDNFFRRTINSGDPQIGAGQAGGRGTVEAGQLESSNVEIPQEFARMIVAQRGFSANARTIQTADEMLEELTNLIR